jgi:excisionase family DNA binding protein
MTTKARRERRGTAKRWFSSSQAARYLGVSVDTIRDLDESRELQAERTKGGHRRFSREKLDAYLGNTKRGRNIRPEAGARRPPPRASRAQRIPEPPDDDPEDLELMDAEVEAAVEVPPPVRVPQPNSLERLVRDMTEQLKRDRAEAPRRRLVALKQYGLNQVPWGVPDRWRPKVATALEGYVTLENFPSWVSDQQAYAFVRGKVEEVLQPYRDEVARGQQETQDQRRLQALIDYGKRYASGKAPFDWESEDRDRALRDVERMLKDSVEPDWTEQRVKDAVDDQLDEREEEPDEEDDENDENEEETDEF